MEVDGKYDIRYSEPDHDPDNKPVTELSVIFSDIFVPIRMSVFNNRIHTQGFFAFGSFFYVSHWSFPHSVANRMD